MFLIYFEYSALNIQADIPSARYFAEIFYFFFLPPFYFTLRMPALNLYYSIYDVLILFTRFRLAR